MDFDAQLRSELSALEAQGLCRKLPGPLPAGTVNFSSNDYLDLAAHPDLRRAAKDAMASKVGAQAARLIGADLTAHRALEERLARFKRTEAALLFSSGYQANLGTLPALAGPADAVYCDLLNHASLIDGSRLSGAKLYFYRHLDLDHLARKLSAGRSFRRRLVVTDSVFGMDGDIAPLAELSRMAQRHDALLFVDEAHASGMMGPHGAGLVAETGAQVDVQLMTFGKALGTFGAAILGSRPLIDLLATKARSFIFTTALPPAISAATHAAVDLIASPEGARRRDILRQNTATLAAGLTALGYPPKQAVSPILPIVVGSPYEALAMSAALLDEGYFTQAIRPPTVPQGKSRLRLAVTAGHTPDHIAGLLDALGRCLPARQRTPRHEPR